LSICAFIEDTHVKFKRHQHRTQNDEPRLIAISLPFSEPSTRNFAKQWQKRIFFKNSLSSSSSSSSNGGGGFGIKQ